MIGQCSGLYFKQGIVVEFVVVVECIVDMQYEWVWCYYVVGIFYCCGSQCDVCIVEYVFCIVYCVVILYVGIVDIVDVIVGGVFQCGSVDL